MGCRGRVLDAVHHREVRGQGQRLSLLAAEALIEGRSVSVDYCCQLSGFGLMLKEELTCFMPGSDDTMITVSDLTSHGGINSCLVLGGRLATIQV